MYKFHHHRRPFTLLPSCYKCVVYSICIHTISTYHIYIISVKFFAFNYQAYSILLLLLFFFFWPCHVACEITGPQSRTELRPRWWKSRILITGLPGNSQACLKDLKRRMLYLPRYLPFLLFFISDIPSFLPILFLLSEELPLAILLE